MDIGNRIKQLRKSHSIKAIDLAKSLDITAVYLSYIEKNNKQPSLDLIQRICDYFRISMADFFAEKPIDLPPDLITIVKRYNHLNTEQKDVIRAISKLIEKE